MLIPRLVNRLLITLGVKENTARKTMLKTVEPFQSSNLHPRNRMNRNVKPAGPTTDNALQVSLNDSRYVGK